MVPDPYITKMRGVNLKMKKCNFICLAFILFGLSSCASRQKPEIYKTSGFVLDENRNPVFQYGIEIKDQKGRSFYTETDKNGMFYFTNIESGEYEIRGSKKDYGKIPPGKEVLNELGMLCYQVNTADSIINFAERDIEKGRYEEALNKLDSIFYEGNSIIGEYILFVKNKIQEANYEES